MPRGLLALVALFTLAPTWDSAFAQLAAFPGAEGAARNITGGRGGDVYHVINLNDSGAGSLRYGIQNAPAAGRTVVFDVDGTINLTTSLDFNGKDNITIAGQTAPGGGITLAGNRLRINPLFIDDDIVDPISNVIVQFLRVRPGDFNSNTDGVWVQTANNVIIDHVTTSWSVDENLSVTHDSDNVTVQWSTMSQGLFDHSYGSLINGGTYTYANNLYMHNKSRNPRVQESGDTILELDFVNNVIYNPQDRFGYSSGDEYDLNLVSNYGIKGPGSNDTTTFLMRPSDLASRIYVDGNFMDTNNDGLLNGSAAVLDVAKGPAVFKTGDEYTLRATRVNVPQTNVRTAEQAYIQVLSRAGASNYRDAHDRDMIRDLFNQQPGYIESQAEWGPYPTLPAGSVATDTNQDGVPDAWAASKGYGVSEPLNTTYADSGYTYLEEYIHSLTPYAYVPAPENTESHAISTAYGQGADAQVNENGGLSAMSSGSGSGTTLNADWGGASGSTNQAIVLKFDLSEIVPGSVIDAALQLTASAATTGTRDYKIWGLEHDAADWDWEEAAVQFNNAPGLVFDGNSRTLGINPAYTADGLPAEQDNQPLATPADLLTLGKITVGPIAAGQSISFDNPNLAVFLNLAAYFEGEAQDGIVTIILEQIGSGTAASFHSKEGNAALAPKLVLDSVLAPMAPPVLLGDFNGDDVVDAADYTVWRNNFGTDFDLAGNGNEDGDSLDIVDEADYDLWKQHYGDTPPLGGGGIANASVPEPTSAILLVVGALTALLTLLRNRSQ